MNPKDMRMLIQMPVEMVEALDAAAKINERSRSAEIRFLVKTHVQAMQTLAPDAVEEEG
tara:strand:+ start:468 stop:644 length:177 start_codon:yes stop_codon:yes gene_type:complete